MRNILTGEILQQQCDAYFGYPEDFASNPIIKSQKEKHVDITKIEGPYDNPSKVFCYSHRISEFSKKLMFFKGPFILFSHNSDYEIHDSPETREIINSPMVKKWYAQNLCFYHYKLHLLPIGLANSQWPNGNLELFKHNNVFSEPTKYKIKDIYFHFNLATNPAKREYCYDAIKEKGIKWLERLEPLANLKRLGEYKYAICPEGNGCDTHRLWECIYLGVVPIVVKSMFTQTLLLEQIPVVVLDKWESLDVDSLMGNYSTYFWLLRKFLKESSITDYSEGSGDDEWIYSNGYEM